jgi:hypothetical protein
MSDNFLRFYNIGDIEDNNFKAEMVSFKINAFHKF